MPHNPLKAPSYFARMPLSARRRLLLLLVGCLGLLGYIYYKTTSEPQASFLAELSGIPIYLAPTIIAGLGLTGIIFAGGIDLSISTIIVVAGTVFGICFEWQAPPVVCFLACFLTAVALSAWNGFFIRLTGISPIIVTLAGLPFYRGIALMMAFTFIDDFGGGISIQDAAYQTPAKNWAAVMLTITVIAALLWEAYGKTYRKFLALGCSPEACRIAGLNPGAILQSAYVVGGIFLGIAAVLFVTNLQVIEPARMAVGFELGVIGAVVLGGTNIFGGEGSLLGTILGALFLYLIGQAMLYAGISEYWRTAIQGAIIVGVIGFDCALHRRGKLLEELR